MRVKTATALTASVLVAAIAGCSSGGSSQTAGSGGTSSAAPSTSTGSTASGPSTPVTAGEAADSSKAPVLVGFENAMTGAYALPDVKKGFEAGVAYVNAQLGGINGSPMKVAACDTDGTPDAAVSCGNTFVSDKVVLATLGFDFGADGILPVLEGAKIAEFGYQAVTPGMDSAVGEAYFASPSTEESFAAAVVMQHQRGVKDLAMVMPQEPAMQNYYSKIVQPVAAKLGMTVRAFYYPASPDWASFAATVTSTDPGGMTVYAADSDSLAAIPAIRAAGYNGLIDASTSTTIIGSLPAATLKNVLFATPFFSNLYDPSALTAKVRSDLAAFVKYTQPTASTNITYAEFGFYTAVQAANMLTQIAKKTGQPLTAASVHSNIANTKGPEFFRNTTYDCSSPSWPGTTSCSTGFNYGSVNADKQLVPIPGSPINISAVKPSS